MYLNQIFAQIESNGVVRNLVVGDNYTEANLVTQATFGEGAFAVDVTYCPIRMEDINQERILYEEGKFLKINGEEREEIPQIPTEAQRIKLLEAEKTRLQKVVEPVCIFAAMQARTLSDEQALQVPTLYPEWTGDGVTYQTDERIRYQDILYKVLQAHTSQEIWTPDTSPSLFAKILVPDEGIIPNWERPESTNGYAAGDKVCHGGEIWESLIDENAWEPGEIGTENQWKKVR